MGKFGEPWPEKPASVMGDTCWIPLAHYARARACVNALAGVEDPAFYMRNSIADPDANPSYQDLRAENERLKGQLPDGMKHCTILFKECELGHGRLTATNWIQDGCRECRMDKLQEAVDGLIAAAAIVCGFGAGTDELDGLSEAVAKANELTATPAEGRSNRAQKESR